MNNLTCVCLLLCCLCWLVPAALGIMAGVRSSQISRGLSERGENGR